MEDALYRDTSKAYDRIGQSWSRLGPSPRRLFAGMDGAALLAGARGFVGIERLVERRQVLDQVLHLDLDAVHQRAAFEAIPFEAIDLVGWRVRLDHETDRAGRALRRMAHMRRQQEDVAFADRHVIELPLSPTLSTMSPLSW